MTTFNEHAISRICPYCWTKNELVSGIDTVDTPEENDYTVCATCGEIARFGQDLQLEKVSTETLLQLSKDEPQLTAKLLHMALTIRKLRGCIEGESK